MAQQSLVGQDVVIIDASTHLSR